MTSVLRFLILSLLLFAFGQTAFWPPVKTAAAGFLAPIEYGGYTVRLALWDQAGFILRLGSLRRENERLTERIADLESELAALKEARREAEVLRGQLELPSEAASPKLLAHIIGRANLGTEILLNRGRNDGAAVGDVVVVKNFLLGMVTEAGPSAAKARLILSPQLSVFALDQDSPGRGRGVVHGTFGQRLTMEKILPSEEVEVGDLVVASGEDGKFPKGLIVGRIESVAVEEGGVLQKAVLTPLVDFDKIEEVFVIK